MQTITLTAALTLTLMTKKTMKMKMTKIEYSHFYLEDFHDKNGKL